MKNRGNASDIFLYPLRIIGTAQPELNRWFKWSHSPNYSALFICFSDTFALLLKKRCKILNKFCTNGKQPLDIFPMRLHGHPSLINRSLVNIQWL